MEKQDEQLTMTFVKDLEHARMTYRAALDRNINVQNAMQTYKNILWTYADTIVDFLCGKADVASEYEKKIADLNSMLDVYEAASVKPKDDTSAGAKKKA